MTVLHRPTLVLNRNWQPVNVTPVSRALVLVYSDAAQVVDPHSFELFDWAGWTGQALEENEAFVQAITRRLKAPEVIALTEFDRVPRATVAFSRRNIFKRDHYTCQYCGRQPGGDELTIDHVRPRSHGGTSTWENCVLACVTCNKRKADRTPAQAGMKLPRPPVRPAWKPTYAAANRPLASWTKFLSEAYWNAELVE